MCPNKYNVFESQIFVVGSGGIGCELLKNLCLSGFKNISIIDLDTIELSNLNRQFLFNKNDVGKSKSEVAKEKVLSQRPSCKIVSYCESVTTSKFNVSFFKNFDLVIGALDNLKARSHVNRMCLAANIPFIDSGTAGYFGQVKISVKSETECYDCLPKAHTKTYASCTIRNTPSEPVHCVVWAKNLFNLIFGEDVDNEEDVSPDLSSLPQNIDEDSSTDDRIPKPNGVVMENNTASNNSNNNNYNYGESHNEENGKTYSGQSTRSWIKTQNYDPIALLTKLFSLDISYLLSMTDLWKSRRAPQSLNVSLTTSDLERLRLHDNEESEVADFDSLKSVASIDVYEKMFAKSFLSLVERSQRVNRSQKDENSSPTTSNSSLSFIPLEWDKVTLKVNTQTFTLKDLQEKVLKQHLCMISPDVEFEASILISSEEDETVDNLEKSLSYFNVDDGSMLTCDDFLQNLNINIIIVHNSEEENFTCENLGANNKEEESPSPSTSSKICEVGSSKVFHSISESMKNFANEQDVVVEQPKKKAFIINNETRESPNGGDLNVIKD